VGVARGRIVAIGSRAAVGAAVGRATRIDCGGRLVLPGLIDPHLHLFAMASAQAELDCAGHATAADLVGAVERAARGLPAGAWIRGSGLDERRVDRLPLAAELERAAPRNPVRLRHRSRHASVLSLRGLAELPPGTPGVDHASGLVAGAEAIVSRTVGNLPASMLRTGFARVGRELASLGITTVADATPRRTGELAPLRRAMAHGELRQRVFAMRPPDARRWRAHGRLAPGPVKILVDEGPDGMRPDPAAIARLVARAVRAGDQVAIHCVGAATLVAALDAFAAVPPALRARRRHRLEHVAECPPPLIARIAALGLTVVTNPSFVYSRGDVYREETPGIAASWLYRARSLARAGIPLAGASDAPVGPASPWLGMMAARRRRTASGASLGAAEALTRDGALALFTTGAARALHADALGRLRPGGPADLVVIEHEAALARPDALAGVWLTMIGGDVAWPA
jgi:predicted amidohydrolase YtcJ